MVEANFKTICIIAIVMEFVHLYCVLPLLTTGLDESGCSYCLAATLEMGVETVGLVIGIYTIDMPAHVAH